VIGVARDRATLERLRDLGADEVVAIRPTEGGGAGDEPAEDPTAFASRLREAAGPVDVVLDCLYGAPLEAALQVCAPHARVVNIGHSAGPTAQVPAGLLRGKQLTLIGFAGLHVPLSEKRTALHWLWDALVEGRLQTEVTTVPLEELPSAWHAQAGSPHGKYVVLPRPERARAA
jgi:NADPH2:quinone reductase